MKNVLSFIFVLFFISLGTPARSADISLEKSEKGYKILVGDELFTEYITDQSGTPILWPLIGPTGKRMTRDYPMIPDGSPGEPKDHPHQRSFWFTHGDVNGVDFWAADPINSAPNSQKRTKGIIRHDKFSFVKCDGKSATLQSENSWLTPKDEILCTDRRTFVFSEQEDKKLEKVRTIDFEIEITGQAEQCRFGDTKEGTFGIRVASSMDVDAKKRNPEAVPGKILNAQGDTNDKAWGKRSEWVEYSGVVDGEQVFVRIINDPASFRYPSYWHVRTYGLFAANPFGEHDFLNKKEMTGEYTLKKGETIRLKYRVVLGKR